MRKNFREFFDAKVSSRNPYGIPTNFCDYSELREAGLLKLYANGKVGWVHPKHVVKGSEHVLKWKVLVSKAHGRGEQDGGQYVTSRAIIAAPGEVCTETYLILGVFDEEEQAVRLKTYAESKFFMFMLSLLKITQDTSKEKFAFVPDIGTDRLLCDQDLYARYGLNAEEIDFIEKQIRAYKDTGKTPTKKGK